MDYVTLGRTGLRVSVMGLGCGGPSRLGQSYGNSERESVEVVRAALAHGVTFFDTAEAYGTEKILAEGLRGTPRTNVVISTKMSSWGGDGPPRAARVREALEGSLKRLGTDYVDVYHIHGLGASHYDHAVDELVPEMLKLRDEGKLRSLGVTEAFASDPGHEMLQRAVRDDCWDVIMVGFNILNQSARERVLTTTREKDIGVLIMFAVRRALRDPANLAEVLADLAARDLIDRDVAPDEAALDFLIHEGGATSLQDAAYRFCRYEPGVHVVLSGTGSVSHVEDNAASLTRPPLPEQDATRLREMFARVDDVSGN
jgi:aryl-alcohol dehydrogenase-like predicted oxidoreductase